VAFQSARRQASTQTFRKPRALPGRQWKRCPYGRGIAVVVALTGLAFPRAKQQPPARTATYLGCSWSSAGSGVVRMADKFWAKAQSAWRALLHQFYASTSAPRRLLQSFVGYAAWIACVHPHARPFVRGLAKGHTLTLGRGFPHPFPPSLPPFHPSIRLLAAQLPSPPIHHDYNTHRNKRAETNANNTHTHTNKTPQHERNTRRTTRGGGQGRGNHDTSHTKTPPRPRSHPLPSPQPSHTPCRQPLGDIQPKRPGAAAGGSRAAERGAQSPPHGSVPPASSSLRHRIPHPHTAPHARQASARSPKHSAAAPAHHSALPPPLPLPSLIHRQQGATVYGRAGESAHNQRQQQTAQQPGHGQSHALPRPTEYVPQCHDPPFPQITLRGSARTRTENNGPAPLLPPSSPLCPLPSLSHTRIGWLVGCHSARMSLGRVENAAPAGGPLAAREEVFLAVGVL